MTLALIGWMAAVIIGAVCGLLASVTLWHRHKLVVNLLVGILGALTGYLIFDMLWIPLITDLNPLSLLAALIGAAALLVLMRVLYRRRDKTVTVTDESGQQVTVDDEEEERVPLGRRRLPLTVPLLMIALFPLRDIFMLNLRVQSLTERPAPFGTVQTYQSEEGELEYVVYAPRSYQDGTEIPLLLFLHGCTQDPYQLEEAAGMRSVADANNFLVAYPQQNTASSPHRCWNWYDPEHQQRDSGEPALLVGITRQVMQEYSVDERRVYVAGLSSGGAMTSILASCYPDVFAAAAVHSGMAYESAVTPTQALAAPMQGNQVPPDTAGRDAYACAGSPQRPMPVLIVHGTADVVVNPINAQHTLEQFAQMNDLADDASDNDSVRAEPTNTETGQVEDGFAYTIENYGYDGELLMQRYIVDSMGHIWSGGTGKPPISDPRAPNASQIIWDFASAHHLP